MLSDQRRRKVVIELNSSHSVLRLVIWDMRHNRRQARSTTNGASKED
jgi:hypothetical protein